MAEPSALSDADRATIADALGDARAYRLGEDGDSEEPYDISQAERYEALANKLGLQPDW